MDKMVSAISFVAQATSFFHPIGSFLAIGAKTYETVRDYQNMSNKAEHGEASEAATYYNLGANVISLTSSIVTLGASMAISKGDSLSYVS